MNEQFKEKLKILKFVNETNATDTLETKLQTANTIYEWITKGDIKSVPAIEEEVLEETKSYWGVPITQKKGEVNYILNEMGKKAEERTKEQQQRIRVTDVNGQNVNLTDPKVKHVVEAMNKDYTGFLKKVDDSLKSIN